MKSGAQKAVASGGVIAVRSKRERVAIAVAVQTGGAIGIQGAEVAAVMDVARSDRGGKTGRKRRHRVERCRSRLRL